ncbi:Histone-lysine N-methyltransferase SMYD3 [Smittium culicis]|uniref:Histone-lysine N-methyltransferase SMYD3 n=1 Tax=Smittium culicis TaxID=133412 RepID=A0A1R1YEA8_9FUNG|nr:Histone-lysine N-methyltransferase SMYD3 [Smittium culicis]
MYSSSFGNAKDSKAVFAKKAKPKNLKANSHSTLISSDEIIKSAKNSKILNNTSRSILSFQAEDFSHDDKKISTTEPSIKFKPKKKSSNDLNTNLTKSGMLNNDNILKINQIFDPLKSAPMVEKLFSFGLKTEHCAAKGAKLVSSKEFSPGDLIFSEKTNYVALHSDRLHLNCSNCLLYKLKAKSITNKSNLKRCSTCKSVYYCSRECQLADWPLHKLECKLLSKHKKISISIRLVLRILVLLNDPKNSFDSQLIENSLESHFSRHSNDQILNISNLARLVISLNEDLQFSSLSNKSITLLFLKIYVNAFCLIDSELDNIGIGLFTTGFLFNHSCAPNCFASFSGNSLYLRALTPIIPGEELTISYLDQTMYYKTRQAVLEKNYFFKCNCSLCSQQKNNNDQHSYHADDIPETKKIESKTSTNSIKPIDVEKANINVLKTAPLNNDITSHRLFNLQDKFPSLAQRLESLLIEIELQNVSNSWELSKNDADTPNLQNSENFNDSFSNNDIFEHLKKPTVNDFVLEHGLLSDLKDSEFVENQLQKVSISYQEPTLSSTFSEKMQLLDPQTVVTSFIEKLDSIKSQLVPYKKLSDFDSSLAQINSLLSLADKIRSAFCDTTLTHFMLYLNSNKLDICMELKRFDLCLQPVDNIINLLETIFQQCSTKCNFSPKLTFYKVMKLKLFINSCDPIYSSNKNLIADLKKMKIFSNNIHSDIVKFYNADDLLAIEFSALKNQLTVLLINSGQN